MKGLKKLKVWQDGIELVEDTYKVPRSFSQEELYGLTSQIERCGISIPSSIAEGSGRNSDKDFSRVLDISLASCFELETQLIIAHKLEYLSEDKFDELTDKIREAKKMITDFKKSITNK